MICQLFILFFIIIKSQQIQVRGRGWNRISFQGNSSHSNNMPNMAVNPHKEEWDPEYTPKSRKYYLVHLTSFNSPSNLIYDIVLRQQI